MVSGLVSGLFSVCWYIPSLMQRDEVLIKYTFCMRLRKPMYRQILCGEMGGGGEAIRGWQKKFKFNRLFNYLLSINKIMLIINYTFVYVHILNINEDGTAKFS